MFGLFGSKEVTQRAYDELLKFLTAKWLMKDHYARAFLDEYRGSIAKLHKQMISRVDQVLRHGDDAARHMMSLEITAAGGMDHLLSIILVTQAYRAYMSDLRRGKHVGTNIELAIWAILSNGSDLVQSFDKFFGRYIQEKYQELFPSLFDDVFDME